MHGVVESSSNFQKSKIFIHHASLPAPTSSLLPCLPLGVCACLCLLAWTTKSPAFRPPVLDASHNADPSPPSTRVSPVPVVLAPGAFGLCIPSALATGESRVRLGVVGGRVTAVCAVEGTVLLPPLLLPLPALVLKMALFDFDKIMMCSMELSVAVAVMDLLIVVMISADAPMRLREWDWKMTRDERVAGRLSRREVKNKAESSMPSFSLAVEDSVPARELVVAVSPVDRSELEERAKCMIVAVMLPFLASWRARRTAKRSSSVPK